MQLGAARDNLGELLTFLPDIAASRAVRLAPSLAFVSNACSVP
jgi:hypothetical protein